MSFRNLNFKSPLKLIARPASVLVIGLSMSLVLASVLFYYLDKARFEKDRIKFENIEKNINLAFEQYLHPLQGVSSLIHYSNMEITPRLYRKASDARGSYKNFVGALGFGFIRKINSSKMQQYVLKQKNERAFFELKRLNPKKTKTDSLFIIELIEPYEKNKNAVGLVVSDEEHRNAAAIMSMKTGLSVITKSIQLVQANAKEPGFLYFKPIYRTVETPSTEAERVKELEGWAYAPLLAKEIIKFITDHNPDTLPFLVSEVSDSGKERTLHSSKDYNLNGKGEILFRKLKIAGQDWTLRAQSESRLLSSEVLSATIVFFLFSSITFLLYGYFKSIEVEREQQVAMLKNSENAVKAATAKLSEKSKFLQSVINNLPALVGYWDKNLINKLSNSQYLKYFNKKENEIIEKHISELLPPEVYKRNLNHIKKVLSGVEQEFESILVNSSGESKTTLARYIPDIHDGEVAGFFVIVIDISEIRALEEQNKEKQAMLFEKTKLSQLGEMASGIAHEINNPLAIISGKSQRLTNVISSLDISSIEREKCEEALKSIILTTDRIAKIINGLRAFSRDTEHDPDEIISLEEAIEDALSLSIEKIKNKNINLEIKNLTKDIRISGNLVQISQVMMNLINNSIDAITDFDDKWIHIYLTTNGSKGMIRVVDCGNGIQVNIIDKIMNPFFTTKPIGKGTGIGLSISKGLIEKHKGSLAYELFEGHSSFVITLPLYKDDSEENKLSA